MTARWRIALLAALPVVGLAMTFAANLYAERNATEWRIPVTGFDPRDLFRGQYAVFQYAWAVRGDRRICAEPEGCALCLEGGGAQVVITRATDRCAARIDPVGSGFRGAAAMSIAPITGRVWISEGRAAELDRRLRAGDLVVVAKLTPGGRLVPKRLETAP